MMRVNSTDDSGVPLALGEVTRSLVFRKLTRILAVSLLGVALLQGFCIHALVGRRPHVLYVVESTLLSPFVVEEEVHDAE